jgi:hypothetical protein
VDDTTYIAVMNDALSRLDKLYVEREAIDGEIMKAEQLIAATANMLPDNVKDLAIQRIEILQQLHRVRDAGLTDAIRAILKKFHTDWMTVTKVRDHLTRAGFDFTSYSSSPLASISAILRRMKAEEVEIKLVDGGVSAYRWKDVNQLKPLPEFFEAAMKAALKEMK